MSSLDAPVSAINVGSTIAGKYRVDRVLGRGAMGEVFAATHIALGQRVAIKVLLTTRAAQAHERFLREARAVVPLRSQHVTRVSDVGTLENGAPYLAMELLDGRDLAAVLEERGRLPIPEAVEYVLQACEAVGEAHRNGIVHRDLKPANLFLTTHADGSPCVKVLDFGVSKVAGAPGLKLTTEGQAVGSPLYMSPEQMLGKLDVDERSDIWALGVILYELIAGWTPFHSETMVALQTAVLVKPPVPLATHLPNAPPQLEAVILQCVDKERDRRWPTVAAFAAALVPFAPPRAVPYGEKVAAVRGVTVEPSRPTDVLSLEAARMRASQPAATVPAVTYGATTTGATSSQPASAVPGARRGWVAVGLATGLVAVALGAVVVWRTGAARPGAPVSSPDPIVAPPAVTTMATLSVEPQPVPTVAAVTAMPGTTPTASARVDPTAVPTPKASAPARSTMTRVSVPAPISRPASPGGDLYDRGDKR